MRRVELLPRAVRDLESIPAKLQEQVIAKIEMLQELPEMGPAMLDAFDGYRSLVAGQRRYRIVYRVRSDGVVEIAWIRHVARRPLHKLPR